MIFGLDYIREKFFKDKLYGIRFEYYGHSLIRNLARISYSSLAYELQNRKEIWCNMVEHDIFKLNPCYLRKCSKNYRKKLFEKYFSSLDGACVLGEINNILEEYNLRYVHNIHTYNKVIELIGQVKNLLIKNNIHDTIQWIRSLKEV